ncbi:MAG: hypothetical protein K9M57_00840 [Phycisphaerae bacterium]|nr:hypothetical protein [Phycisphaerae bacterium]
MESKDVVSDNLDRVSDEKKNILSRLMWLGCVFLVIAAALHSADKSIGGGDTWVAMACGRYSLGDWCTKQEGRTLQMKVLDLFGIHITQQDPFGERSRPYDPEKEGYDGWINQNWLTHVLFYKMKIGLGENSIVWYKFIQAVLTALFAYWAARVLGAHPTIAAGAVSFGILLSRSFVDLRPNVSTILFAAIMILLLSYWKQGRFKAILWMFPVMVIWSNIHGGFIYAIMIFVIAVGGYGVMALFGDPWPGRIVQVGGRGLKFLVAGLGIVIAVPAIFSPYGLENLIHPLLVAVGNEGEIWRQVIEWKPIFDESGFGNEVPYLWFLGLLGLIFVAWFVLFFMKPARVEPRKKRQRQEADPTPWPKLDLAQLGIIGITIIMSIKSRRFIFLGGVVLSPYMAIMVQDCINMVRIRKKHGQGQPLELSPMSFRAGLPLAGLSVLAVVVMGWVYVCAMQDIYYRPAIDGQKKTVFRNMVGIDDQPVRAMKFFDANKITGVVFNEWTNGGYVAFGQTPREDNGQPPCKVYMDGRAQAAYRVSHFTHYNHMKPYLPKRNPGAESALNQLAGAYKLSLKTSSDYEDLVDRAQKDNSLQAKIRTLALDVPELFIAVKRYRQGINQLITRFKLKQSDPKMYEKLIEAVRETDRQRSSPTDVPEKRHELYYQLVQLANADPDLYGALLRAEGVNIALLSRSKSETQINLLTKANDWAVVYWDNRSVIFADKEAPENRHLFKTSIEGLAFPDEFSRKMTIGRAFSLGRTSAHLQKGLAVLQSIEYPFSYHGYDMIRNTGMRLHKINGVIDGLIDYFSGQREAMKKRVDSGDVFGRRTNLISLAISCRALSDFCGYQKKTDLQKKYYAEFTRYNEMLGEIQRPNQEGWFW